jgi:tRNA(His) guanylyltransferase
MKDDLGDRMKSNYEDRTRMLLPRRTNVIIRIDGKAFHTYTRKLDKPFDVQLIQDMIHTTRYLCANIQGCKLGYVQSDEISLFLTDYDQLETNAWFDYSVQKMASISASIATAAFNQARLARAIKDDLNLSHYSSIITATPAHFDSRVFTIPELSEVANYFLWRGKDAARNSVQMYARSLFSHKSLHAKSIPAIHEMIKEAGYPAWETLSTNKRYGTVVHSYPSPNEDFGQQAYGADTPTYEYWNGIVNYATRLKLSKQDTEQTDGS